jgi:hypothetical protein
MVRKLALILASALIAAIPAFSQAPSYSGSGSAAGVASVSGTANQVTVSPTTGAAVVSLPSTLILPGSLSVPGNVVGIGTDNSAAGTLNISNGSANAHTTFGSAATTSNTILGFATAPTTGHLVTCTTSGTTCTLTDGGAVPSGGVNFTVNGGSNLTGPVNFQNGTGGNIINFSVSGSNVQATIPIDTITNSMLQNPGTTVSGQNCVLGSSCTVTLDGIGSPQAAVSFTMPATYGYTFQGTAPASTSSGIGTAAGTLFTATGAAGGATTGSATTAGAGGGLNFTAGAGGSGSGGTNASGGAGGSINLIPGLGGAKSGSGSLGANGVVQFGTPGTIAGVLSLAGSTSGNVTITPPAVAGTTTNAAQFSNALEIPTSGSCSGGYQFGTSSPSEISTDAATNFFFCINGNQVLQLYGAGHEAILQPSGSFTWFASGTSGSRDTGVTRVSAGVVGISTSDSTGSGGAIKLANVQAGVLYSAAGTALPSCASGIQGEQAVVSDATSPTYMGTYTPSGGITSAVICSYNGSTYSWLTH